MSAGEELLFLGGLALLAVVAFKLLTPPPPKPPDYLGAATKALPAILAAL